MRLSAPERLVEEATREAWRLDPDAGWALARLGDRCAVVFDEAVDTAQISRRADGSARIAFSPTFVRQHLRSPAEALFVLLHELQHRTRGDLVRGVGERTRTPVGRFLANVVADIRINGALLHRFAWAPLPLLDRLYGEPALPGLLLLPPHRLLVRHGRDAGLPEARALDTLDAATRLPEDRVQAAVARVFQDAGASPSTAPELAGWYLDAWFDPCCTDAALFERLRAWIREVAPLLLLGDHEAAASGRRRAGSAGRQGGAGGEVEEDEIDLARTRSGLDVLTLGLRAALEPTPSDPRDARYFLPERSVVPAIGRREAFLLGAGVWPTLFLQPGIGSPDEDPRARVYVDVSASTGADQPRVYALLHALGDSVRSPVHLFSNVVAEVSLGELAQGRRVSTGGTDFNCFVEHALARRFRRILVVTDGYADLSSDNARALRERLELHLVLLNEGVGGPLSGLAKTIWFLNPELREDDLPF